MNNSFQDSRGRRRGVWLAVLLLAGTMIGLRRPAAAHDLFAAYVQHSVQLIVGARHIDLTLDVTFFEEPSARERGVMDADANGHITRSEMEIYVKKLAPSLPNRWGCASPARKCRSYRFTTLKLTCSAMTRLARLTTGFGCFSSRPLRRHCGGRRDCG